MNAIHLLTEHDDGPEAAEYTGEPLVFDPRDPRSLHRTQRILRERFGLAVAPPLCSEPGSRLREALRQAVTRWRGLTARPGLRAA